MSVFMTPEILNAGLNLAMEFGENWLMPIQNRLGALYPELGPGELDQYNALCQEAMRFGHEQTRLAWRHSGGSQAVAYQKFSHDLRQRYAWVSEDNLSRLFSQGSYSAWKDGEIP